MYGERYTDLGTIEGKFDGMIAHGNIQLYVWEEMEDRKIRCFISDELFAQSKHLFQHRVAVTGPITYSRKGIPISIEVERIHGLKESSPFILSKFKGIRLVGGKPEEFVRGLRNAQ